MMVFFYSMSAYLLFKEIKSWTEHVIHVLSEADLRWHVRGVQTEEGTVLIDPENEGAIEAGRAVVAGDADLQVGAEAEAEAEVMAEIEAPMGLLLERRLRNHDNHIWSKYRMCSWDNSMGRLFC
eukprot:gb/GECG01007038.1/.p1 GENE.gb/GECG01007038.1/~~gb/GECG01007038.1/.p1  ORF type:complete len:124 (+),score=9.67 gb/GECG01007038.1/:1-372(+)